MSWKIQFGKLKPNFTAAFKNESLTIWALEPLYEDILSTFLDIKINEEDEIFPNSFMFCAEMASR